LGTRDPGATRQRILDAALREFSDKGIAGARVDAIAARACVNKRMLYYYFGSKEGLFREILQQRLDESLSSHHDREALTTGRMARGQLRLAADVDYLRLLTWEALEAGSGPVVNESVRRAYFAQWVETIEAEQRAGNIPADLDPAQFVLSELCLVLGPLVLPQLTRLITGNPATSTEQLEERGAFLDTFEPRLQQAPARQPVEVTSEGPGAR
jgi:AcrR family transcriptional regulator